MIKLKTKKEIKESKNKKKIDWKEKYELKHKELLIEKMENQNNMLISYGYLSRIAKMESEIAQTKLKDLRVDYNKRYNKGG